MSGFILLSSSQVHAWYCLVRQDLVEPVAELVWGHCRDHIEVDLEPMTLCNLAKRTETMIY